MSNQAAERSEPVPPNRTEPAPADRSYRALLRVPTLGRILLAMQLARIAQSMVSIALVLFTLEQYHSAALAGLVTFVSIFPGLLVAPIAGALLDRHGRIRLITLDYVVELVALVFIGLLAIGGALTEVALVLTATIMSFTAILSAVGLRSLFPILVPEPLWERVNAVDSNGYVVATIIGPPLAAGLVGLFGGATTLIVVAVAFGVSAVAMIGIPDPLTHVATTGRLLADSWQGVVYWWRNPTLRALAFSVTVLNLGWGMITIAIPLIVLDVLGGQALAVGLIFGLSGVSGMISAFIFGGVDTRGREWHLLVIPMLAMVPAIVLMLPATVAVTATPGGAAVAGVSVLAGFLCLAASALITGFLGGPMDIAMFTVRQRRTDPAWMGRAFAVSMAANFAGFPIGAAIGGATASVSLPGTIVLAAGAVLTGGILAVVMVPRDDPGAAPRKHSGAAGMDEARP